MPTDAPTDLGPIAYAAYGQEVNFRAHDGTPMRAWEDLTDGARRGWRAAGDAAGAHLAGAAQDDAVTGTPTYSNFTVSLVLGRGVVVDEAPESAKISVGSLGHSQLGIDLSVPGRIKVAWQVEYEITGYDPTDCSLTLRLVNDWRPGQKDAPPSATDDDPAPSRV